MNVLGIVRKEYPDSAFVKPAHYWNAMSLLFLSRYDEARPLIEGPGDGVEHEVKEGQPIGRRAVGVAGGQPALGLLDRDLLSIVDDGRPAGRRQELHEAAKVGEVGDARRVGPAAKHHSRPKYQMVSTPIAKLWSQTSLSAVVGTTHHRTPGATASCDAPSR